MQYHRTSLIFKSPKSLNFRSLATFIIHLHWLPQRPLCPLSFVIRMREKEESDVIVLKSRPGYVCYLTILNISNSQFPLADRSL